MTAAQNGKAAPDKPARFIAPATLFILLFLIGAGIRLLGTERPIDTPSWRECDIGSISRNFYREGMNILYPRIDWRRDGPGFAEMEFPLYPWLVACLYKLFGVHEVFARLVTWFFSLVSMAALFGLARRLLPTAAAAAACVFFIVGPLPNAMGHAIQPEGLMLAAYLLAACLFVSWMDTGRIHHYVLASIFTALAILAKSPAAHIGIFFCLLLYWKDGFAAFRKPLVLLFPFLTLTPALLWYGHAYRLWRVYQNSLGVSNEDHWIGLDFFRDPRFAAGVAGLDLWFAWLAVGVVVAGYGIWADRRSRVVRISLSWLASVAIYYFLCARTVGSTWAWYYHVVSAPAAALLFGHGIGALRSVNFAGVKRAPVLLGSALVGAVAWTFIGQLVRSVAPHQSSRLVGHALELPVQLALLGAAAVAGLLLVNEAGSGKASLWAWLALAAVCPSLYIGLNLSVQDVRLNDGHDLYEAAKRIAPALPPGALIVTTGGICEGRGGHMVASDASYMFYWLDRKGFSICREKQSLAALRACAKRGATYFIAENEAVAAQPGFDQELRNNLRLIAQVDPVRIYRISP